MAERQTQYKHAGKDSETLRKGRIEQAVTIRKEKRDDVISKRRNIPIEEFVFLKIYLEGGGVLWVRGIESTNKSKKTKPCQYCEAGHLFVDIGDLKSCKTS